MAKDATKISVSCEQYLQLFSPESRYVCLGVRRLKMLMITFKFLVLHDPQRLCLCCIAHSDVIFSRCSSHGG